MRQVYGIDSARLVVMYMYIHLFHAVCNFLSLFKTSFLIIIISLIG